MLWNSIKQNRHQRSPDHQHQLSNPIFDNFKLKRVFSPAGEPAVNSSGGGVGTVTLVTVIAVILFLLALVLGLSLRFILKTRHPPENILIVQE